ncbi:MAG TPA: membrane protein insertase YidC [Candidatus Alistipes excrementipullorum]|nr:membrane protein insertase YidC [Candidatus Alistipes excrementipullorum]
MDKKSIIGIILTGLIFVGFAVYTTKEQQKYQKQLAEYNAYMAKQQQQQNLLDAESAETAAEAVQTETEVSPEERAAMEKVARYGETLAAYRDREPQTVTVENEFLKLDFSTRGGQIINAELKEYTKYAPKGERNERVRLFDPATARFDMSFYVKNGTNNVKVNTSEYDFEVLPLEANDSLQRLTMRLPVAEGAYFTYVYTVHNGTDPERDYLVDLDVHLENMAPVMSKQSSLGIMWSNTSYQNERGFQNENTYTTVAYRLPKESSISDIGMSEEGREEEVSSSVNWVAFKQQFFSSVLIARSNFTYADMSFDTCKPGSGYIKDFMAEMSVPYNAETDGYNFAFYLGPNKYAILKNITDENGDKIALERLIPLGWGIFGWVNRWVTIPVFDFLRQYISSFGIIILILAILVKLVISPLTYKSYLSSAKMRVIKPEMDALNAKYPNPDDAMKKQQAMMDLYKKAGINPLGGCLPMLIQMPIIIALFRFFPASIELREQPFLWSDDLSSYDSVLNLPFNIPFYGDHVSLFALLMAGMLFFFSYVNYKQTASGQPQMVGMKFMMVYLMPLITLFWFNNYSSGLCFYYFLTTALSLVQTYAIRYMMDDNKIHAMIQANAAKKGNGKKSKFQQRYEEIMRQQEQMMKQQNAQKGKRK